MESYTDSNPLVKTIALTKIVENKLLVNEIKVLKELLMDKKVKKITVVQNGLFCGVLFMMTFC